MKPLTRIGALGLAVALARGCNSEGTTPTNTLLQLTMGIGTSRSRRPTPPPRTSK